MSDQSQDSPATLPVDSDYIPSQSQDQGSQTQESPYGMLFYLSKKFKNRPGIELRKPVVQFGKSGPTQCGTFNDYIFEEKDVGSNVYERISRTHFKIEITIVDNKKLIKLTDLSSNGTFVNGNKIEKGGCRILSNGDTISITLPDKKFFAFYQLDSENIEGVPCEITSNYSIVTTIGKGGFGRVYRVVKKDSFKEMAMKVIELNSASHVDPFTEPKVMYEINHPNIVTIFSMLRTEDKFFLFLEYMGGGDLAHFVKDRKRLPESIARHIIYQTACGLAGLHAKKIIHRDVKPLNILLDCTSDYPVVKITDFGLAKQLKDDNTVVHTYCGTRAFTAPELIPPRTCYEYDDRVDIWSLGVVTYFCLTGQLPFVAKNGESIESRIKYARFDFEPKELWKSISLQPIDLIKGMLKANYQHRPYADAVLTHSWFKKDSSLIQKFMKVKTKRALVGNENCSPPKKMRTYV